MNAGKVATAHDAPVAFAGTTVTGYLLINPATGAGAYKITGGTNGGFLDFDEASILGFIGFAIGLIGAGLSLSLLVYISAIIAMIIVYSLIFDYLATDHRCSGLGGLIGLGALATLAGIFTAGFGAVIVMYIGLLAAGGAMAAANSSSCRN